MSVLKRDFLPNDLQEVYIENNINGCIAVQASQTEAETQFLHDFSIRHDFIKGVVGWVDLRSELLDERLEYFTEYKNIVGFRHIIQDEADPEFMSQSHFKRGISKLESHGFTYDILIYPTQLDAALQLIKEFPNQKFVIDHLAKPYIKDQKITSWKTKMQKFAVHQNVSCKLSGMVTEANWQNWKYDDFTPYLNVILEVFGTSRLMFGSDWPVCLLSSTYRDMKDIVTTFISSLSSSEKKMIMGLNALDFYNIKTK